MGSRLSLHEDFVRVKTLMGLEPFEVRFFVGQKFTKFNLALKLLVINFWKLVQSLLIMFLTIWLENFLVVKSLMGTPVDWKIFTRIFFFSYGPEPMEVSKSKSGSVRLKSYLYDSLETTEFFWVKTPMGIQRFEVQFRAIFIVFGSESKSCSKSALNWVASRFVISNHFYWLKSLMGAESIFISE